MFLDHANGVTDNGLYKLILFNSLVLGFIIGEQKFVIVKSNLYNNIIL